MTFTGRTFSALPTDDPAWLASILVHTGEDRAQAELVTEANAGQPGHGSEWAVVDEASNVIACSPGSGLTPKPRRQRNGQFA